MLTLESVRAAVLSDQPWKELDALVRLELAAGQRTKQVYEQLVAMADEIDRTPGLSEDSSDAFGEALDALTGMCHPNCQYKDPPNTSLPTEEEIAKLPRWARVAFAARCARRMLPFFLDGWPPDLKIAVRSVTHAIELGERISPDDIFALNHDNAVAAAMAALDAAAAAKSSGRDRARLAALIAGNAAFALANREGDASAQVAEAVRNAGLIDARAVSALRRDFDRIATLAEWQKWTDDTPVPPEVFGPLWPEGTPKGWPAVTDAPERTELALSLYPRERATTQVIRDEALNLFNALNQYHIARSGVRLTLDQFRSLLPALAPAEV